jgi:hypothetical protein
MEIGDEIICVDNNYALRNANIIISSQITLNKIYIIKDITPGLYYIKNNNDHFMGYFKKRFISKIEFRRLKLLKIKDEIHGNK